MKKERGRKRSETALGIDISRFFKPATPDKRAMAVFFALLLIALMAYLPGMIDKQKSLLTVKEESFLAKHLNGPGEQLTNLITGFFEIQTNKVVIVNVTYTNGSAVENANVTFHVLLDALGVGCNCTTDSVLSGSDSFASGNLGNLKFDFACLIYNPGDSCDGLWNQSDRIYADADGSTVGIGVGDGVSGYDLLTEGTGTQWLNTSVFLGVTVSGPPVCNVSELANMTLDEDTSIDVDVNLSREDEALTTINCSDPDNDALTYGFSANPNGVFSLTSNDNLSVQGINNITGEALATISVTDGVNTIYFDVNATFTPVNDNPWCDEIGNTTAQNITENDGYQPLDINASFYFRDV